jgi:phage virion morphogenesis (putative tail completion) protein
MITASVDLQLTGLIANPQRLSSSAVAEFFRRARVVLAQDHAERFEKSIAPDGSLWQSLSPRTLRKSVQQAIRKVGGRAARPVVRRTRTGGLIVRALSPQAGYQRTATVRRTRASKILVDTGRLKQSVVVLAASADAVRTRDQLTLVWGTRVPYARQHQQGDPSRNLPARPFLGVSRQAERRLQAELQRIIARYVSGGA